MSRFFAFVTIITIILSSAAVVSAADHYWFGKTMTAQAAETRWGKEAFAQQRFKNATSDVRAKMASSLLMDTIFQKQYPHILLKKGKLKTKKAGRLFFCQI